MPINILHIYFLLSSCLKERMHVLIYLLIYLYLQIYSNFIHACNNKKIY